LLLTSTFTASKTVYELYKLSNCSLIGTGAVLETGLVLFLFSNLIAENNIILGTTIIKAAAIILLGTVFIQMLLSCLINEVMSIEGDKAF
jgi:hypothetical protein